MSIDRLSLRERDCLTLLMQGRSTKQVASTLGISLSTLNKHLASARQKIGVASTSQAMLAIVKQPSADFSDPHRQAEGMMLLRDAPSDILSFAERMSQCFTFEQAWNELHGFTARYGVTMINFGVAASPRGHSVKEARLLRSSLPEDIMQLYENGGGANGDPVTRFVLSRQTPMVIDNRCLVAKVRTEMAGVIHPSMIEMGGALLDIKLYCMLIVPARDELTSAPYATVYSFDAKAANAHVAYQSELRLVNAVFWMFVQSKRLLRQFYPLTECQRETLIYAMRGFSTTEIAGHMGVSLRSTEKTLASARSRLGARTTTEAVYRAMVYRLLI